MNIKLLDKNVCNQISAGEVVEKPASIVKELVENSIDAGATEITVEIKNGGTTFISVSDNGCGIKKDEIKLAFLPHATSKLTTIEDLNTITSMGFRGEALSSISAVSNVEMITKTKQEEIGTKIELIGGDVVSVGDYASVNGTKIIVKDLFFNTPARAKFLRKNKTEEADITSYVQKLMLSNEQIDFRYIVDDKIVYNTTKCTMHDVIYTIYGQEVAESMIRVSYQKDDFKVDGYISKPCLSKNNRTYQSLFINKRFCLNSMVSASIQNAYQDFLMKGKFPVYVLNLALPQNAIDVNVHPNKLEVKFENPNRIYGIFNNAIFEALHSVNHVQSVQDENETKNKNNIFNSVSNNIKTTEYTRLNSNEGVSFSDADASSIPLELTKLKEVEVTPVNNVFYENKGQTFSSQEASIASYYENIYNSKDTQESFVSKENANSKSEYCNVFNDKVNIVGVAFNTYIIVQENNNLFFIDQHAAHERQLYDCLVNEINLNKLTVQDLIIPYVLNVNEIEGSFLEENMQYFIENGFEIREFGKNCFKVETVPTILTNINLGDFFNEIFSSLIQISKKPQNFIKDQLAQMACKAAVKAGNILSDSEINALFATFKKNNNVLLCPHGRPIVVAVSKKQLEKWFKRIV